MLLDTSNNRTIPPLPKPVLDLRLHNVVCPIAIRDVTPQNSAEEVAAPYEISKLRLVRVL